jgi:hypothetical protein
MSELAKALCAARATMKGTVFKGGVNQHQKYPYVGHEDVMTSGARDALNAHGLAPLQTKATLVGEVPHGKVPVLLWRATYRILHTSGEFFDTEIEGTTQAGDKCAYQANTMLDRTMYLRLLALAGSAEENTEHDAKPERAADTREPATNGHAGAQAAQNGAPAAPTDADITALLDGLEAAQDAAAFDRLRATSRGDRSHLQDDERTAITNAIQRNAKRLGVELKPKQQEARA